MEITRTCRNTEILFYGSSNESLCPSINVIFWFAINAAIYFVFESVLNLYVCHQFLHGFNFQTYFTPVLFLGWTQLLNGEAKPTLGILSADCWGTYRCVH